MKWIKDKNKSLMWNIGFFIGRVIFTAGIVLISYWIIHSFIQLGKMIIEINRH